MASGQDGRQEFGVPGALGLAKPLYLQRLERSLKLDSFLRQTAAVFNRDITRYRKTVAVNASVHLKLSTNKQKVEA